MDGALAGGIERERERSATLARAQALTVAVLAAAFVVLALAFAFAKREALAYHPRDYAYLLSTTVKVFDPDLSDEVTLQPHGVNFLQFEGNDGHRHLLEGVHFEPNRVAQSALYRLYPREGVLYALYALVFAAPVVYVAVHHRGGSRGAVPVVLFALAWLLLPSSLEAATWDLRPYALLAPVFVLAVLSNHYRRPWWESALLFLALLSIREEALMLGAVVLAHAAFATRGEAPHLRRRRLLSMGALWLLWWPVTLLYFHWTGYEWHLLGFVRGYFLTVKPKVVAGYVVLAAALAVLGAFVRFRPRQARALARHPLTAYLLVFGPIAFVLAASLELARPLEAAREVVYGPRWSLAWLAALGAVPLALDGVRHPLVPRVATFGLGGLVVAALAFNVLGEGSPLRRWPSYERADDEARLVLDLRERIDPRRATLLLDEATYQAFWDYDGAVVYENLPWRIAPGEERWWPRSAPHVVELLRDGGVDYVVLRQDSRERVLALAAEAGVTPRLRPLAENSTYVAYAVDR